MSSEREDLPALTPTLLKLSDSSVIQWSSFDLGMDEWTRLSEPPRKKLRLSLRHNRAPGPLQDAMNRKRFGKAIDSATLHEVAKE